MRLARPIALSGPQLRIATRDARLTKRLFDHAAERLAFSFGERFRLAGELGGERDCLPTGVGHGRAMVRRRNLDPG